MIRAVRLHRSDILTPREVDLAGRVTGRTVTGIERRGKRIVFSLDNGERFYIHLGMSGRLMVQGAETPLVRHTLRRVKATLRAARPEDAPRISVLLEQLGWVVPPDEVVVELSASPTTEVVVAELDDVVGLIAVTTRRQFQRAGNLITIDTLVVDERHRSRGIGEQLVGVALEAAARSSAQAVEAVSHIRRVDARRFYERLGFEVTSNYFVRTC